MMRLPASRPFPLIGRSICVHIVHAFGWGVPERPEVETPAGGLGGALAGSEIESTMAPGITALKPFAPPLHALDGRTIEGVRRIGKHLVVDVSGDLHVLCHLMSAGRLQLYDKRASLRDRTSRLL